jgi:glutaredoxin-like YruB-family protein
MTREIVEINDSEELEQFKQDHPGSGLLLFYSAASQLSRDARDTLREIIDGSAAAALGAVDVGRTKELHGGYGVTSVPTLLLLGQGTVVKRLEGKQSKAVYEALLAGAPARRPDGTEAPPLRVTVYSTPTCPHCTTVKSYLRKNRIRFRDVDVSRDVHAAEELTRRSGSTGVPQTDINGTLVVGADMARLNELLGIRRG